MHGAIDQKALDRLPREKIERRMARIFADGTGWKHDGHASLSAFFQSSGQMNQEAPTMRKAMGAKVTSMAASRKRESAMR